MLSFRKKACYNQGCTFLVVSGPQRPNTIHPELKTEEGYIADIYPRRYTYICLHNVRTMSAQHLPRETYILREMFCGHSADIYLQGYICPHYILLRFSTLAEHQGWFLSIHFLMLFASFKTNKLQEIGRIKTCTI